MCWANSSAMRAAETRSLGRALPAASFSVIRLTRRPRASPLFRLVDRRDRRGCGGGTRQPRCVRNRRCRTADHGARRPSLVLRRARQPRPLHRTEHGTSPRRGGARNSSIGTVPSPAVAVARPLGTPHEGRGDPRTCRRVSRASPLPRVALPAFPLHGEDRGGRTVPRLQTVSPDRDGAMSAECVFFRMGCW